MNQKIAIALDVSSRNEALTLVRELNPLCGMFKVGSQLYMAAGPAIIPEIIDLGGKVFLDVKFHDIPNTVTHAAIEAAKLGVSMMTVHASGGRQMMQSAAAALQSQFPNIRPLLIAVTVLTSFDTPGLFEIGIEQPVDLHVKRLALLADECGMDGVVCSPKEIGMLRSTLRPDFKLITPGIRMASQSANDQQRLTTPAEAISAGADYIVVGRAVTGEAQPRAALEHLLSQLQQA